MSNSIQPPPPPVPVPPAPAAQTTTVTIQSLPDVLAQLPKGAVVEAQVVSGQADGTVRLTVTTPDAVVDVNAKLPLPLPSGTTVSLKALQSAQLGDAAQFRLTAINGNAIVGANADLAMHMAAVKPIQNTVAGATVGVGSLGSNQMAGAGAPVSATSTVGVGRPISALVLRNDLMQDPQGNKFLIAGTRLSVRMTQISMPDVSGNGSPSRPIGSGFPAVSAGAGQSGGQPGSVGNAATGPDNGQGAGKPAIIPGTAAAKYAAVGRFGGGSLQSAGAGQNLAGTAPSSLTGGTSQVQTPGNTQGANPTAGSTSITAGQGQTSVLTSMTGRVIGLSAVGQPTIQVGNATLALDVRAPLPPGTQIRFDVLSALPPQPGATAAALGGGYGLGPPNPWATLDALWQSLGQADAQAAARLAAVLPQPGPQMLANMAAAMTAIRSGDVNGWLRAQDDAGKIDDKAAQRIKKLADRLTEDVRDSSQAARKPVGEWRGYSLPMLVGGEVERIQMLVRRAPDRDDGQDQDAEQRKRKASDVRFLLDLSLSRLGVMQLDGLVNTDAKSFDLVVRTHSALPKIMPKDMLGVFADALKTVGYTGSLAFRVTSQFIVPEDVIDGGTGQSSGVEV